MTIGSFTKSNRAKESMDNNFIEKSSIQIIYPRLISTAHYLRLLINLSLCACTCASCLLYLPCIEFF